MKTALFLAALFFSSLLMGQIDSDFPENQRPTVLGFRADYGFILIHSSEIQNVRNSFPFGIGLDASKHLLTEKARSFCSCYPRVGFQLGLWNWDSPSILGNGILAIGYVEPFFRTDKRTNLFVHLGFGTAFMTKPYDEKSNAENLSYSTYFNFPIRIGLGLNYRLNQQWNIRFAAKYNHISNGGISTPNKGLNYPTLSVGIDKNLTAIHFPKIIQGRTDKDEQLDPSRLFISYLSGWSDAGAVSNQLFYVSGLEVKYSRWLRGKSAISGGTEMIADFSRKVIIEANNSDTDFLRASILLGHEFWLGKVTFSQQIGIYYYSPLEAVDPVYQRYGLSFKVSKKIHAGFNLKVHRHIADFFDIRVGIRMK